MSDGNNWISEIPGWFDWRDTYARWSASVPDGGTIVEVGVFCGKSFAHLAEGVRATGKGVALHAVDTWGGSPELMQFASVRDGSFYDAWRQTKARIEEAGTIISEHRMPSVEAAQAFADGSVDYVWLDGDHSTAGLLADLAAWWPKVKPGGEIGGHDFGWFGVTPAVERFAQAHGIPIEVLDPNVPPGTTNVSQSFLLRKPIPATSWDVPEAERSVLICPVTNHPNVVTPTVASLFYMSFHAKKLARKVGFRAEVHFESQHFTLDGMRDRAAARSICEGFSHLLFLDCDNTWPHDLMSRLLPLHPLGIVSGVYHIKKPPHEPVVLIEADDDPDPNMYRKMPFVHEETEPVQAAVIGMGCTLIPSALFQSMSRPWFKFQYDQYGYPGVTEDIWFCQHAKAAGAKIWADPTLNIGHVAQTVIGVKSYLPYVEIVAKAHRANERGRRMASLRALDLQWLAARGLLESPETLALARLARLTGREAAA